jgi:hypothetical protein
MKRIFFLIATIFAIAVVPNARAQWVQVGLPGTHITSLAANQGGLFAGTGQNVYRSTDGGVSWQLVIEQTSGIYALVGVNNTVYAGGTDGILISTDAGSSWSVPGGGVLGYYSSIVSLAASGSNLTSTTIYAGTAGYGIYLSTDGGQSWSSRNNGVGNTQVFAVAMGGTSVAPFVIAGTRDGAFFSEDSGTNWTGINTGLTDTFVNALAVFTASGSQTMWFAGTNSIGVFSSTNNGSNWTQCSGGLPSAFSVHDFAIIGTNIFAGAALDAAKNPAGVFLTADEGTSWKNVSSGLMDTNVLALLVAGPYLYAGTQFQGIWRRPLSDFGIVAAVEPASSASNSLGTYPNPFTQSTTINFITPESGAAEVSVMNLLGTEVAHIFSGEMSVGEHTFTWKAIGLPDGIYECIVRMGGNIQRVPMVMAR